MSHNTTESQSEHICYQAFIANSWSKLYTISELTDLAHNNMLKPDTQLRLNADSASIIAGTIDVLWHRPAIEPNVQTTGDNANKDEGPTEETTDTSTSATDTCEEETPTTPLTKSQLETLSDIDASLIRELMSTNGAERTVVLRKAHRVLKQHHNRDDITTDPEGQPNDTHQPNLHHTPITLSTADIFVYATLTLLFITTVVLHLVAIANNWSGTHELALFGLLWIASVPTIIPTVLAMLIVGIDAHTLELWKLKNTPLPSTALERMSPSIWALHVACLTPIYLPSYIATRARLRRLIETTESLPTIDVQQKDKTQAQRLAMKVRGIAFIIVAVLTTMVCLIPAGSNAPMQHNSRARATSQEVPYYSSDLVRDAVRQRKISDRIAEINQTLAGGILLLSGLESAQLNYGWTQQRANAIQQIHLEARTLMGELRALGAQQ